MPPKVDNRRYTLFYRGNPLLSNVAYPVANGKKGELMKLPNWGKIHFEIKRHEK